MGILCQDCGKAWATKQPDSDGGRRCYAHSRNKTPKQGGTTSLPTDADLTHRAGILRALSEAYEMAKRKRDPHGMVAAARTAIQAASMTDPMAPDQELGGFVVTVVTAKPANDEREPIQPMADAE